MRSRNRQSGRSTILGLLCVVLVLVATMAQAMHVCGLGTGWAGSRVQISSVSGNSRVCLVCLTAQTAAATVLLLLCLLQVSGSGLYAWKRQNFRPRLTVFHLYVRPPPAH